VRLIHIPIDVDKGQSILHDITEASEFNVNMREYHSHDMVVPDFVVQSAGASDGGWHGNMVGLDGETNSERVLRSYPGQQMYCLHNQ